MVVPRISLCSGGAADGPVRLGAPYTGGAAKASSDTWSRSDRGFELTFHVKQIGRVRERGHG